MDFGRMGMHARNGVHMKRIIALSVALVATLAFAAGCGDCGKKTEPTESTETRDAGETFDKESLVYDDEPLDVESRETPEGVVNRFFRTFFRGDAEGAFSLLSEKAREAQSENFAAQASDTIRWRVVEKSKPTSRGRVYVWVEVEDYAESGEIQRDALAFAMTNDSGNWRVSGFNVGDVVVDFEESVIVAQETPDAPEPEQMAARIDEMNTTR